MKAFRFAAIIVYVGYLVHVGLMMVLVPWSGAWPLLLVRMPPAAAAILDAPALRGAISGFGVLQILLVMAEVFAPRRDGVAP